MTTGYPLLTSNRTLVKLIGKKPDKTFEKKIETIARKIVEHFLLYFSDKTNKHFPTVTIKDPQQGIINLNDYFKDSKDIILHKNHTIECNKNENAKKFTVKIFKVFFSDDANSISLSAHNREVTTTRLDYFVPEFAKHFTEMRGKKETAAQNFIIKAYVLGDYLDDNIYVERNKFNFSKDRDDDALYPFSQREIEREVSDFLRKEFTDLLNERQLNKIRRINQYVDEQEPWYRNILDRLDLSAIPETISDKELGTELHSRKSALELNVKKEASEILASETIEDADKVNQIVEKITDIGKSDLTHYIANRKVILEIFEKSLKWDEKGKYQPEDVIHNIIFPMKHNSDSLPYDKNNLWIIDERLNFNTYMASDKKLASGIQPDLLMFDKPVAMREGYEPTNPVTIFEFKKPQKKGYKLHDEQRTNDPIKQIADYADDIRAGKVKTPEGREIKVDPNTTPFYGLVICDFNESARSLFRGYALTRSSDGESYYGFHSEYRIYFEVMSFDKLLKDAKLRNRIFFKKLGIE
jgi:methionine-rich copper-binding protein CopC